MLFGMTRAPLFFLLLAASFVTAAPLPQLPPPAYADTEVTTNCPLASLGGRHGEYTFSLSFSGTASNCVEVALGNDGNANGRLSAEETNLAYGWRNGRWFLDIDPSADRAYADAGETEADARTLTLHVEFLSTGAIRLLSCEADGGPVFTDLTATAPTWGDVSGWTSVQLLARGAAPGETFTVLQSHIGTIILFR